MKIVSFNIKCDDTIAELEEQFLWKNRQAQFIAEVKSFGADIYCFQEVMPHQYEFIKDNLINFKSVFQNRDDNATNGEGCPIFYNKNKFKLVNYKTFWLSETPSVPASSSWNSRWPRICTYVILQNVETNEQFAVFNTHLDHKSEEARTNAAKMIYEKIIEINLKTILCGDFNSSKDMGAFKFLNEHMLNADAENKIQRTFHVFGKPEVLPPHLAVIDYMFVKDFNVNQLKVYNDKKIYEKISDHYALGVEIQ